MQFFLIILDYMFLENVNRNADNAIRDNETRKEKRKPDNSNNNNKKKKRRNNNKKQAVVVVE